MWYILGVGDIKRDGDEYLEITSDGKAGSWYPLPHACWDSPWYYGDAPMRRKTSAVAEPQSASDNIQMVSCHSCGSKTENKISLCSTCENDIWPS